MAEAPLSILSDVRWLDLQVQQQIQPWVDQSHCTYDDPLLISLAQPT
jgi:hypothetical protein